MIAKSIDGVPPDIKERVFDQARAMQGILGPLSQLEIFGRFERIPAKRLLPTDESAYMQHQGTWQELVAEKLVAHFGRDGMEAVSSVQEAVCYAYTLAEIFSTEQILFRGEHKYGNPLRSRAERRMEYPSDHGSGLTPREISELRRFQNEVASSPFLTKEIVMHGASLPSPSDPIWLPIMQHYDEEFGTRLLDLSSSIYTALYFACVDWNGVIDDSVDGILYLFMRGGGTGGLIARGFYYDKKSDEFDPDFDELAPSDIAESFKDWCHAEYFRIYKSSSASPREVAQDGWFLVRGDLGDEPHFGQGFKFRIPAAAKSRIARQLWLTGYTPERMVRGPKGRDSREILKKYLGIVT